MVVCESITLMMVLPENAVCIIKDSLEKERKRTVLHDAVQVLLSYLQK